MKSKPKTKKSVKTIDRTEFIIIIFFVFFGIVWMQYIIPQMQDSAWFNNLTPVGAYFVYNIGIISIFTALFGIPVGYFISEEIDPLSTIKGGFMVFIGFSWLADLQISPLAWTRDGILAVPLTHANMEIASVDYMFGWIFQQFGAQGHWIYDLTYTGVPILTIVILAFIYSPAKLLKIMGVK